MTDSLFQNTYAKLPDAFFAKTEPTSVREPKLIAFNDTLGIDLPLEVLAGNKIPEGAAPIAMVYSGHQFGSFNPHLGDGRAILLGEIHGRDVQLKGSGPTPFSRRGDGRSALGPVLREYLVSEAMHALGVPTTRALAAVWSGDQVLRETHVPGGVFTRVASSHLRIGTVQYFAARQDQDSLKTLVNYAIKRHYPDAENTQGLLEGVIARQAKLVAHWMSLGFIHGVMNTDNMSLSGETIDYGPCAFMDRFHPARTFSYIDQNGRYAWHNQPPIAQWNLCRLAEALLPLLDADAAKDALSEFPKLYEAARLEHFSKKLGLPDCDWDFVQTFLNLMQEHDADFTLGFRNLSRKNIFPGGDEWFAQWLLKSPDFQLMKQVNPIFIPRNHRIEDVIAAGNREDFEPFHRLHKILQRPFDEQPESSEYEETPAPEEIVQNTFCGT